MKNFTKFLTIAIIGVAFSANTFAQLSANASATAEIVTPLTINKTVDMNFGKVAVTAAAGTVVLSPTGATSVTGGCTTQGGTVAAATFTVTGQAAQTYAVTLPASCTLSDGTNNMTVNTFTSDHTGALPETLHVGATLNVLGSQPAGVYNSTADFTVTVNYN